MLLIECGHGGDVVKSTMCESDVVEEGSVVSAQNYAGRKCDGKSDLRS